MPPYRNGKQQEKAYYCSNFSTPTMFEYRLLRKFSQQINYRYLLTGKETAEGAGLSCNSNCTIPWRTLLPASRALTASTGAPDVSAQVFSHFQKALSNLISKGQEYNNVFCLWRYEVTERLPLLLSVRGPQNHQNAIMLI